MSRYRAVSAPQHPRAHRSASTKTPWLQEHILIAERALGKPLPRGTEVHHVDESKANNARTNLTTVSRL